MTEAQSTSPIRIYNSGIRDAFEYDGHHTHSECDGWLAKSLITHKVRTYYTSFFLLYELAFKIDHTKSVV